MLPYWAWIIIAVGIVLFLAFAVWLFIGIKFFKIACDRRLTKKGKDRQPFVSPDGKYTLTYNWDWLNAQKFEEVKITALDKTILHGHLLRNPKADHRYLISFHGYRGEWQELSRPVSYVYDKLGFSVLMIEERGHDESGYPIITFGDRECYDVGEWVKFILLLDKDAQIAIYGLSMGAATVMMSLDKGLPKNVRCAVADCGFSSIKQQMNDTIKNWFHLPPHFIVAAAQFVAWFHGFHFNRSSALKSLAKDDIPILLIHGEEDTYVPYYNLMQNYQAVKPGTYKEKATFPHAWHAMSFIVDEPRYEATMGAFLTKFIAGGKEAEAPTTLNEKDI